MSKLSLPTSLLRMNLRVGVRLAITVGINVALVSGMVINQYVSNSRVVLQTDLVRAQQSAATNVFYANIALQRMHTGIREIRLAAAKEETAKALADLQVSKTEAVANLKAALELDRGAKNQALLVKVMALAKEYADAIVEMAAAKEDRSGIDEHLTRINAIADEIDLLVERSTSESGMAVTQRMTEAAAGVSKAAYISITIGLFVAIILVGAGVFGILSIGRPIRHIAGVLRQLANGLREIAIPYTGRGDEIGDVARAAETFRNNLVQLESLEAEQQQSKARAAAERTQVVHQFADTFEDAVGKIAHTVLSAAVELESAALVLTHNADTTQRLSAAVATASTQASDNVHSMASATVGLESSIDEIGRRMHESTRIAAEAVKQVEQTDARIAALSQSAGRIGDVVKLITTIAGQTNLLALNATIEAARAGEAGRGFAVVAAEVKILATQTAKATEGIKEQIAEIQTTTEQSVAAIKEIGATIGRISEIASTITAAVEIQSHATQEIACSVAQAAQGAAQVATNIMEVNNGAGETSTASTKVLLAAQSLSGEGRKLQLEVQNFINTVRAA